MKSSLDHGIKIQLVRDTELNYTDSRYQCCDWLCEQAKAVSLCCDWMCELIPVVDWLHQKMIVMSICGVIGCLCTKLCQSVLLLAAGTSASDLIGCIIKWSGVIVCVSRQKMFI